MGEASPGSLWTWAVTVYAREGVAPACLRLQDDLGQNICLLLWASWTRTTEPERIAAAVDLTRRWEAAVVAPLRQARRGLKRPAAPISEDLRIRLHREVQELELEAERGLLEALESLGSPAVPPSPVEASLRAASAAWGKVASNAALDALAAALV